ncbi:MAG TPA: DNA repair protein RecN [Acidimicrobiales bacterium]|nr:DNA repair protein RecN [Acidimicrobiales bacterium]
MLTDLHVRDLGVIEDLTLHFEPGMSALTGETGAGKTLLVEALQLVLGGRAGPAVVRAGAPEALVEARFLLPPEGDDEEREVILARSVPASGRSRAWLDGRMVPVSALVEAGAELVDIHGQHDQQSLVAAAAQRRALDAYAGSDLAPRAEARRLVQEVDAALAALGGDAAERAREVDVLGHQLAEIGAAGLGADDEEAALADEEERLADLSTLRQAAARALEALEGGAGDDGGTLGGLGAAVASLGGRVPFADWEARLRAVTAEVSDVASDLRQVVDTWEDDPEGLAAVQARRRLLADLRRKYGATLGEVRAFAERARERLALLEAAESRATVLEAERKEATLALARAEEALGEARRTAAPRLAEAAEVRLRALAMPAAHLAVEVDDGAGDDITFLLGANPGEPLAPLAKVASGGELARAMLALRLVAMGGPATMVFDEVDAGVGGEAALALARALLEVAEDHQVLVVTHLAQVAALADHQIGVTKSLVGGRTVTEARALAPDGRVVEVSRMLSGHPDSKTARAHAEELLALRDPSRVGAPSTTKARRVD